MRVALKTYCPPRGIPPKTPEEGWCVRQLKRSLNYLGYYIPPEDTGITDDNDDAFQDSLKAFQRAHMVPFDDRAGPDTVTERILNEELDRLPGDALYTWYTVGDEKVRGEHARRDGLRFSWDAPPEGGHPGEDYNCRCWAEPLNPSRHVWAEWARKQGKIHEARAATLQNLAPVKGLNDSPSDLITPVPLDAVNPTWSPFDFVGFGPALTKIVTEKVAIPAVRVVSARITSTVKNPYEIALQGGKHAGFLQKYKNASNEELKKGIKSFDRQISRHIEKTKNPGKEAPDFKGLDQRHQRDLLEKKWPSDIKRLKEEKEILRRILNERN